MKGTKKIGMWKEETLQEIKWAIINLHGPIRAGALAAQNWTSTTTSVLLAVAGLKSVTKDNSIEKRYQLIKSGVTDILYATFGGWIIWQAYNLNETGGSTTVSPITTTEANLPTFPTLPRNYAMTYEIVADQFTENIVNNELTPEMVSIALNKLLIGTNGLVKVISGLSSFDLYKTQRVTKTIEYLKSLTTLATAGFNFKDSNFAGGSLMSISAIMDISHIYLSTMISTSPSNDTNSSEEEIIVKIFNKKGEHVSKTFPLYQGILDSKDLAEIYKYLENNDWNKFELEHSNKEATNFLKRGEIKEWQLTLTKFKEWIDKYTPENKKVEVMIESVNNQERIKLRIPDYDFAPEFVENANNYGNNDTPEVVIDQQALLPSSSNI